MYNTVRIYSREYDLDQLSESQIVNFLQDWSLNKQSYDILLDELYNRGSGLWQFYKDGGAGYDWGG
jgi:hypothetical protein